MTRDTAPSPSVKLAASPVTSPAAHPDTHPAARWERDAQEPASPPPHARLRLAAMAGHLRADPVAARRAALVDLLADGRPHPREEIWEAVAARLGDDCWGKRPAETLARDLKVLRQGRLRIAYSRRPGVTGYYLQHPPLPRPRSRYDEPVNWDHVAALRELSVAEKNEQAFAAADFALRQKRLLLAEADPGRGEAAVEREARRLVFGVEPPPAS